MNKHSTEAGQKLLLRIANLLYGEWGSRKRVGDEVLIDISKVRAGKTTSLP